MRFGVCCNQEKFLTVKNAGYDYVELSISNLAQITEEQFKELKASLNDLNLKAETFNGFFPSDTAIVGENRLNDSQIAEFAKKGLSRAAEIGGEIAIIGSGAARNIPLSFDKNVARNQFMQVLHICGAAAAENGMKIAVEPLKKQETNLINTVGEGLQLVREMSDSNVGCLADFHHMFCEKEDLSALLNSAPLLLHVHLARANEDRRMPEAEDEPDLVRYAKALKAAGYNNRISLEGSFRPDFKTVIEDVLPRLSIFNKEN